MSNTYKKEFSSKPNKVHIHLMEIYINRSMYIYIYKYTYSTLLISFFNNNINICYLKP